MSDELEVVRRLFAAVEEHDLERMLACYADDVEIHEADVLPYGVISPVMKAQWLAPRGSSAHGQPFGPEEMRLDARFWGDGAGRSACLFRHRAADPVSRARFDAPQVCIYQVRHQQRRALADVPCRLLTRWSDFSAMSGTLATTNRWGCRDRPLGTLGTHQRPAAMHHVGADGHCHPKAA